MSLIQVTSPTCNYIEQLQAIKRRGSSSQHWQTITAHEMTIAALPTSNPISQYTYTFLSNINSKGDLECASTIEEIFMALGQGHTIILQAPVMFFRS